MSCSPIHISLEVDPDATDKIVVTLDKTCDDNDQATWKMEFLLQQGDPLTTVIDFKLEIDPENHDKAQATADAGGLDDPQQGQAQIAAGVHQDPGATDDDKNAATQQIIAVRGT